MEVYVVKLVFVAGWRCHKNSFDIQTEMDIINDNQSLKIFKTKKSALIYAYNESIDSYENIYDREDRLIEKISNIENCSDEFIEDQLNKLKKELTKSADFDFYYGVFKFDLLE